jgi:hypothetical protein
MQNLYRITFTGLFCLVTSLAFSQLDFLEPTFLPDTKRPLELARGDFDGDFLIDIAYTSALGNIHVLYNLGNDTFRETKYSFTTQEDAIIPIDTGDFNYDDKVDLVVFNNGTSSPENITIYMSNGDGFDTVGLTGAAGQRANDIKVIDLNGDSFLDIVFTASGSLMYYEGGSSGFVLKNIPTIPNPFSHFDVGDLNFDGKLDVAGINFQNQLITYIANDNGTFTEKKYLFANFPIEVLIADFSGDNVNDIIVNTTNTLGINYFVNNGNGSFPETPVIIPLNENPFYGLDAADFNFDGRLDIITGNLGSSGIRLLRNNGGNNFSEETISGQAINPSQDILFTDLEYDGDFEILALSSFEKLDIYRINAGSYQRARTIETGLNALMGIPADVDMDGDIDLITYNISTSITISYNENGIFSKKKNYFKKEVSDIAIGDFNGDDFPDIVFTRNASFEGPETGIIFSNGNGTFDENVTTIAGYVGPNMDIVDIDIDGDLDIVGGYQVVYGDGNGNFTYQILSPSFQVGSSALGDFNDDSFQDLILSNGIEILVVSYNDGNGHFGSFTPIPSTNNDYALEVSDMNGDHLDDIIIPNLSEKTITILQQKAMGGFLEKIIPLGEFSPWSVATSDVNFDGKKDFVVGMNFGKFEVFLQNETSDFTFFKRISVPYGTGRDVHLFDYNQDGKKDILNFDTESITFILNDFTPEPTVTASELMITSRTSKSAGISLTSGNGNGRIVMLRKGGPVSADPIDGIFYAANATFPLGAKIGSDNYVVMRNNQTSLSIQGLEENTTYHVSVFEFNTNGRNTVINYQNSSATASFTTKRTQAIIPQQSITLTQDATPATITISSTSQLPVSLVKNSGDITVNGNTISILGPGPVSVVASQSGNAEFDEAPASTLTFCINPRVPTVTVEELSSPYEIRLTSSSDVNNQWYASNIIVANETNKTYSPEETGAYKVRVDFGGCFSESLPVEVVYTAAEDAPSNILKTYPNPFVGALTVQSDVRVTSMVVTDILGRTYFEDTASFVGNKALDLSQLPAGTYILRTRTLYGPISIKIIKGI